MSRTFKHQNQQWLFATEETMQTENGMVRVLRNVDHVPGGKIIAARARASANGKAPLAEPGLLYCEMKGSLLPAEAASDLDCDPTHIRKLVELGRLKAFSINAKNETAKRQHLRITSASVLELIRKEIIL